MKCSLCGEDDPHPIYEIINVVYGGKVVGYLCTDCAKKMGFSINPNGSRSQEEE